MEFEKVAKIIAEIMNVDPKEITPEMSFTDDLLADSLDVCQIIMEIESEFQLKIPEDAVDSIKTVGEAYELIKAAKAN